jgi:hypothetical protein
MKMRAGVVLVLCGTAGAAANLSIKDIMGRLNKGPGSMIVALRKELQTSSADWAQIQQQAKEYAELASQLGKQEPPKGDRASWAKLTAEYAKTAESMNAAAEKRDRSLALAAHRKLTASCKACHQAHQQ